MPTTARLAILCLVSLLAGFMFPSKGAAQQHQVTYERVVFERSNEGGGGRGWTQLHFTIEGFLIDGTCYNSCTIQFSFDGNPADPSPDRADLRITRGLVTSRFPADTFGQMFIGYRTHQSFEVEAIEAFREREKLALAWVVLQSDELIHFALRSARVPMSVRRYWENQTGNFEDRLSRVFDTVLRGYDNEIEATNTRDQLSEVIQPGLAAANLYPGAIDGIIGQLTRDGLQRFQRDAGRLETGYADSEERERLAALLEPAEVADVPSQLSHTDRLAQQRGIELEYVATHGDRDTGAALEIARLNAEIASLEAANALVSERAAQRLEEIVARRLAEIRGLQSDLAAADNARAADGEVAETEVVANLRRQPEAANETVADLREDNVPRTELESLQRRLETMVPASELEEAERRLTAANETVADLRETSVSVADHAQVRRQLEAANQTVADLQENNVPRSELESLQRRLETMVPASDLEEAERRLAAANESIADLRETSVSVADHAQVRRQLEAANETIADVRESTLPITQFTELSRQLDAANETIATLRETRVPMEDFAEIRRQLEAANQTVADMRADIAANYVERTDAENLQRQISALNERLVELSDRLDMQRSLRQQADQMLFSFIDDCRSETACARTLRLE